MNYAYPIIEHPDNERFTFYSHGPKGVIEKMVTIYRLYENEPVYNLAFGDVPEKDENSSIQLNDKVLSGNADPFKVLSTVVNCVETFLNKNPASIINIQGSTEKRTQLYINLITRHYEFLSDKFIILGRSGSSWNEFEPKIKYAEIMFTKNPE